MKNLNWKSIGLGVVVDWLTTILLFTLCFLFLIAPSIVNEGVSAFEKMPGGINQFLAIAIGFVSTMFGGYVASGNSISNLWRNCVTFAFIALLLAAMLRANVKSNMSIPIVISGVLLNIPAALLGGLWRWRNLSRANRVLETALAPLPEVPHR